MAEMMKNLRRYGLLLPALALLSACVTGSSTGEGSRYQKFKSRLATGDRVIIEPVSIPADRVAPGANSVLVSSPLLGTSPLEIPETDKISPIVQLAKRVETIASVRHNGVSPSKLFARNNGKLNGIRISRRLLYRNRGDLAAEFPGVAPDLLKQYSTRSGSEIELRKWTVVYFFDLSPDGKSYRIILGSADFIDHNGAKTNTSEDDFGQKKPENAFAPFFGAVTYRFPNTSNGKLNSTSVVFKLFQEGHQHVYTGNSQSSGWLPLQQDFKGGSYNLYFTLVHASNFRSFLESSGGFEGLLPWLLGAKSL